MTIIPNPVRPVMAEKLLEISRRSVPILIAMLALGACTGRTAQAPPPKAVPAPSTTAAPSPEAPDRSTWYLLRRTGNGPYGWETIGTSIGAERCLQAADQKNNTDRANVFVCYDANP